ncbi:MAG: phosphopantetheine-binding protein [Bdellovibrionota bacterium]
MNPTDVVQKIIVILRKEFPVLQDIDLKPGTALLSSGLLDSFAMVTLLASLEQDYAINVDADTLDVMLFETPESIASIVLDPKYHSKA